MGIEGAAEKTGICIVDSDGNVLAMAGKQVFRGRRNSFKSGSRTSCQMDSSTPIKK